MEFTITFSRIIDGEPRQGRTIREAPYMDDARIQFMKDWPEAEVLDITSGEPCMARFHSQYCTGSMDHSGPHQGVGVTW